MAQGGFIPASALFAASTSTPETPDGLRSESFDFAMPSMPAIPPRLSKVGKRISELGTQLLNDFDSPTDEPSTVKPKSIPKVEVPGMGDDPVMCPFCNKPLPPPLFERANHKHSAPNSAKSPADHTRGSGAGWTEAAAKPAVGPSLSRTNSLPPNANLSASAPPSASPLTGISKPPRSTGAAEPPKLLDPLPVSPPPPPVEANSSSFVSAVHQAESADTFASTSTISREDLARWSQLAGIPLAPKPASSQSSAPTSGPSSTPSSLEKVIPAIPPPPSVAERLQPQAQVSRPGSSNSGRFGFFRRGSKQKEEQEESDDEHATGTGYAKIGAPGSDVESDDEDRAKPIKAKVDKTASQEVKQEPSKRQEPTANCAGTSQPESIETSPSPEVQEPEAQPGKAELRKVLQEVLNKVNAMSQSHTDLVTSHAALLTSLKIARSNLAMAEANTEMLEAQLKRGPAVAARKDSIATTPAAASTTSPIVAKANATVAAGGTPSGAVVPRGIPTTPVRGSGDIIRPAPRSIDEKARPTSLQIPRADLSNMGPVTGPAASTSESKGWGFWQGGKKKLPGGLGSVTIPSAAQIAAALDSTSRPATPSLEKRSFDLPTSPIAPFSAALPDIHSAKPRSVALPSSGNASLAKSSSLVNVASAANRPHAQAPAQAPATATPHAIVSELSRLRQAYAAAQKKMETMNNELTELKKGKVEMEGELENLSQALFEEANKMVADERRKRAEVEESLKEVKEEREALRETIKVLGGQVEESVEGSTEAGTPEGFDPASFQPRDLDKHYEALRKTIHHVADGAGPTSPLEAFASALQTLNASPRSMMAGVDEEGEREITIVGPGPTGIAAELSATPPRLKTISLSAPTSPNPWADPPRLAMQASTPAPEAREMREEGDKTGEGEAPRSLTLNLKENGTEEGVGGAKVGARKGGEPPKSPVVEDLERLMERLRANMEEEGQ